MSQIGVVIGRFQCHELTDGHKGLFAEAWKRSKSTKTLAGIRERAKLPVKQTVFA